LQKKVDIPIFRPSTLPLAVSLSRRPLTEAAPSSGKSLVNVAEYKKYNPAEGKWKMEKKRLALEEKLVAPLSAVV
jgi:hypothetical protein